MGAFAEAREFKILKKVDQQQQAIDDYFDISRGLISISTSDPAGSFGNGQPQAVQDAQLCSEGNILIKMDNISNLIETWKAVLNEALLQVTKPYTITPTAKPDDFVEVTNMELVDQVKEIVLEALVPLSDGNPQNMSRILSDLIVDKDGGHNFIRGARETVYKIVREHRDEVAKGTAQAIDEDMLDQIQESNYFEVVRRLFHSFARDNISILKAPQYVFGYRDKRDETGVVEEVGKFLYLENIEVKNYFAAPDTTISDNGSFEFDVSSITFGGLSDAKNCPGFVISAIDEVQEFFCDCGRDWLDDSWTSTREATMWRSYDSIDVLKGRIKVTGKMLVEHGIEPAEGITDDMTTYELTFWLIHDFLVYGTVTLNRNPVGLYRVGGWMRTGNHVYESKGITQICLPYQKQIDKSYRHMIKNQEYSALGIWGYNRNKIDVAEFTPEDLVGGVALPIKTSITDGGNDRPVFNVRVDSNVSEILTAISHFQQQMEEHSQISAFSVGLSTRLGSSVRTTGLGALFQENANRQTLFKISELEARHIQPFVKDLSRLVIWTSANPDIVSGAVDVQVLSLTDIIRSGDEAKGLDFFIQNTIGIINAIQQLEAQGTDTTGLKSLLTRYAEAKGFDAEDIFGGDSDQQKIANSIQEVAPNTPELDGRSQLPEGVDVGIRQTQPA